MSGSDVVVYTILFDGVWKEFVAKEDYDRVARANDELTDACTKLQVEIEKCLKGAHEATTE